MRRTESYAAGKASRREPGGRNGVADIELLLAVTILITIIMLVRGAMNLAVARLNSSQAANYEAFHEATASQSPMYANDPDLSYLDGIDTIRPGMPNRMHVPRPRQEVVLTTGDPSATIGPWTVGANAALPSPPWMYCAWPVGGNDSALTQTWIENYSTESHAEVIPPLALAPAWPP